MTDKIPFFSVIIPTLDREKELLDTLRGLLKQKYPNFEIIIIDQSDEESPKVLNFVNEHREKIKLFHQKDKSLPKARNFGVKKAKGEIILFCDDDFVIPGKDFLKYHVDNFSDPKIGGVMGGMSKRLGDLPQNKIKKVGYFNWWEGRWIANWNASFKTEIDHAGGGNVAYRRKVIQKVGGFDENLGKMNAYLEDTDFSLRVKKAGYKLIFEPKAFVKHLQTTSGGCRILERPQFRYWYCHNFVILILKHFNKLLFPLFIIRQIIWEFAYSIYRKKLHIFPQAIRGLSSGFRAFHRTKRN